MDLIQARDVGIWNFFQSQRGPWIDLLVVAGSYFGNPLVLLVIFILVEFYFLLHRNLRNVTFLLATFTVGTLGARAVQSLVGRERPHGILGVLEQPTTPWGFPSEQTLGATMLYLSLAFMLADAFPPRRHLTWIFAGSLILIVSVSRLFIGTCFPSDVIGSWLGGAAWVLFCRRIYERLARPAQPGTEAQEQVKP
jgi:membrane-associated phospholipid phosphatase